MPLSSTAIPGVSAGDYQFLDLDLPPLKVQSATG
jgi:hypothetical protein